MYSHRSLLFLAAVLAWQIFAAPFAAAQETSLPSEIWREAGFPYIRNFSTKEYGENPQNWSLLQDERGIMYFGNTHGVLIYDGVSWRLIKTATGYVVRSLCLVNGRIYVGGQNDLGYLTPDAAGQLQYISLLDKLPEQYHNFQDAWNTLAIGERVYFQTTNHIFCLENERFTIRSAEGGRFVRAFVVDDRFYVHQEGTGLLQMSDDSLVMAPGGEKVAAERVAIMLPLDSRILVGTRAGTLFLYDGADFIPFPTRADPFLRQHRIYSGQLLPGGLIALGTLSGGVAIVDRAGNLCQVLNKDSGLRDERVYAIAVDREGAMWLALNNGLARVEIPSPLTLFTAASGIESIVESMVRYRGKLFLGTHFGVYYLDSGENTLARFKPVQGITLYVWALEQVGNYLLAGATEGIYIVEDDRATLIKTGWTGLRAIVKSRKYPNRLYVGLHDGLAALQLENGRWIDLGRFPGINERMFDITEDAEGVLWLGAQYQGALRVEVNVSPQARKIEPEDIRVVRFGKEQGLPDNQIGAATVGGRVVLATYKGLKRFDPGRQVFVPEATFGEMLADSTSDIYRVREDSQGNVWFIVLRQKKQIIGRAIPHPEQPGAYLWQEAPFSRLNTIGDIFTIYPERDPALPGAGEVVWFGGSEGIARYTPAIPKNYSLEYSAIIRQVSAIAKDTVYYYGAALSQPTPPVLQYGHNSLRFEFAAPNFDDVSLNQYRYKLEGFDEGWSKWLLETRKDYTGLPEGDYLFKVQAKNVYGNLSREAGFEFTILPPWFRSPWLYFLYVLLVGGLVFALVKYRVRQLERKSHELEKIVAERTSQVVEQRNQLRAQSEKLQEMDRLKSRFFANISHEFRTPLTLILGLLDKFMNKTGDREDLADYGVMKRNAARLLQLINQLLDLAKLEAGGEKLQAARGDIVRFMRRIIMSFASLGEQKQVSMVFNGAPLSVAAGQTAIHAYFDRDKMEKVFYNLLSNAFKFTPAGGRIEVAVDIPPVPPSKGGTPGTPPFEGGSGGMSPNAVYVEIRVTNTGPAIPAEKLPYIFDRFYQADDGATREFEGSGIGLALVKELVELHRGEVAAESVPGAETVFTETTFTVRLPLGRAHLREEEIVVEEAPETEAPQLLAGEYADAIGEPEATGAGIPEPDDDEAARAGETVVLVVEDHQDLRDFIRDSLAPEYHVVEAENGAAGWQKAAELIPDLVISDIMMPQMDGYELCKRLKTDPRTNHVPVILLTARAATEDKLEGLETGADDYLVKPFNPEELKIRVRNLIRLRQQMREKFSAEMLLKPSDITVPSTQKIFLERLRTVIEEHLDDEDFSVEALGEEMGMSRAQIHRKLRAITNQSASEFIRSFRLQRAAELIKQNAGNIAEIAYMVGFNSQAYFTRCFQEAFGCSPSEFKKRQGN